MTSPVLGAQIGGTGTSTGTGHLASAAAEGQPSPLPPRPLGACRGRRSDGALACARPSFTVRTATSANRSGRNMAGTRRRFALLFGRLFYSRCRGLFLAKHFSYQLRSASIGTGSVSEVYLLGLQHKQCPSCICLRDVKS
jgi:hypothetical protein